MSTIDDISASLDEIMARAAACQRSIIVPLARAKAFGWTRQYRGRRARRQAFYSRQRLSRMLNRILNAQPAIDLAAQADDLLRYGTTWVQVSESGARRVPPSEWRAVDFSETRAVVPR